MLSDHTFWWHIMFQMFVNNTRKGGFAAAASNRYPQAIMNQRDPPIRGKAVQGAERRWGGVEWGMGKLNRGDGARRRVDYAQEGDSFSSTMPTPNTFLRETFLGQNILAEYIRSPYPRSGNEVWLGFFYMFNLCLISSIYWNCLYWN